MTNLYLIVSDIAVVIGGCPGSPADRKSTRLNSSHSQISYAVFCLKKKKKNNMDVLLDGRAAAQLKSGHLYTISAAALQTVNSNARDLALSQKKAKLLVILPFADSR